MLDSLYIRLTLSHCVLPHARHHPLPRTYLVLAKFLYVPLFCANRSHSQIDCNKDGAAEERPVYELISGSCQERQAEIYGSLAGVMWTQQVGEYRMRRELIAVVLDAQTVQICMIGVLEHMRCEYCRHERGG